VTAGERRNGGGKRTPFLLPFYVGSVEISGVRLSEKEKKYPAATEEDRGRVFTLGVEMGGQMDEEFHGVLYCCAWAKATEVLGYAPDADDPTAESVHKHP